ncbi:hypothetical protein RN22_05315 [Grimontia sp. AD028]|uniref:Uncharacterized protein n=1 Tax=Grimontia indica TaxID=1056512 RepID=R1IWH2_9GAMM|nr:MULTISPECIES: hypothetical protein [Grimontia]EOD81817.1 hypothetical protein D515_01725 [Grimontia indica]KKD61543.1 hypothetical protein RN22_05315 [Grimontia sp. AD028]
MKRLLILFAVMLPTLLFGVSRAVTLSPNDVAAHMADPASVSKILRATKLFDENDIDALNTYLDSLPELQKEEALTVLARRALDFSTMTPEREKFLVTISRQQPKYLVKSQGDGFWVTMPAFNYAGEAKWVLNRWQIKLMQDEAMRLLNYNQLNLSKWLSFSSNDYALRREAIVTLVPTLNQTQLDKLVTLYLDDKNMVWSPDNALLAALAEKSDKPKVYDLLWLRRTDSYSLAALQKLEMPPISNKHIELMIAATVNPVLAETAVRQLAGLHPLPQNVKDFLQKQIADRQRGKNVVELIARKGHTEWLRELEQTTSGVTRRNIRNGLEQVEG